MAASTQASGQKRKGPFDRPGQSSSVRKRQKMQDARNIPVQPAAAALSSNGELNVASFIKAREFEIGALEKSMHKARKSLTTRAFQQVPSHMRRRTASHNAKKVPRRLRSKAEREMREDNTPTVTKRTRTPSRKLRLRLETAKLVRKMNQKTKAVRQKKREAKLNTKQTDPENHVEISRVPRLKKNTLAEPPKATSKYKKRQVNKTWLPTHLWHTKRAHMTPSTEPLWRMAVPLSPTAKSYRPSHRAAGSRGCIAWDTSYMSTVGCRGTEPALDNLLKSLGFIPYRLSTTLQKKWKSGTRFAEGSIFERDGEKRLITPATIIWCGQPDWNGTTANLSKATQQMEADPNDRDQLPKSKVTPIEKTRLDHRLLIRVHPSAFHQFWQELLKVAKLQKPQVLIEDLRFEIGSVEVRGPGSTESLLGVLRPFDRIGEAESTMVTSWTSLAGLHNPGILPQNAMLSFDVIDPRLSHPPTRIMLPRDTDTRELNEVLVSWPPDRESFCSKLTSHRQRWLVSNSLPSQKAINRRRALAPPRQAPAVTAKDPAIPVILLASRNEDVSAIKGGNHQGSWTVLLPWSCVDPVWRSLMYYPLSAGGTPRFGGLQEKQQLAFEQKIPWFPGDLPGTEAGKAWERTQSEKRFDEWIRRPPKHRIAWDRLDLGLNRFGELGRGWACDWEYLFESKKDPAASERIPKTTVTTTQSPLVKTAEPLLTQRQRKAAQTQTEMESGNGGGGRRRNTSSPESEDETASLTLPAGVSYTQLSPSAALLLLKNSSAARLPSTPALMTIRITLLDKGSPTPAARIYRLPSIRKSEAVSGTGIPTDKPIAESTPQSGSQAWSSTPPAAQQPRPVNTTKSSLSSISALHLRERWLELDPFYDKHRPANANTNAHTHLKKQKTNRFNTPRHQHAYPRESLAKINVLPKDAPPEIVAKFGPDSAFGRGDGEMPKERPPQARKPNGRKMVQDKDKDQAGSEKAVDDGKATKGNNPYLDPADREAPNLAIELAGLMVPDASGPPSEWAKHPPCPDVEDLIGFVTSGGYNLSEGRGTAVGAVWAQRLVEGWIVNGHGDSDGVDGDGKGSASADLGKDPARERRRRLCIVRNAGESIGRLGIWECCLE